MGETIASYVLTPTTVDRLTVYYLVWILVFVGINIFWDIRSKKTEPFHISKINNKIDTLYNGAGLASNVLIIIALMDSSVRQLALNTTVPLILAGFSGIFRSLPSLCPYKINNENDA